MTQWIAHAIVRIAARMVPADQRAEWRREWETEMAWDGVHGLGAGKRLTRASGAAWHAVWLRADRWRWGMMWHDFRHAARALRYRPGFAIVATLSLALGIGANVAIFSVVNAVLLRPLPFRSPARIVQFANGDSASTLSDPELIDLARATTTLASTGAYSFTDANITGGQADAERVRVARVTAGFFETLEPAFAAGRPFSREDDGPGAPPVAVISRGLAARYFGENSSAIGRRILMSGTPRTVVGVLPAGFEFPSATVQVWVPLALNTAAPGERRNHYLRVIGRLAEGATISTAQAEIDAMKGQWQSAYPTLYDSQRPLNATVVTISERVLGATRPYLVAMLGAVAFVLLIASVNVATLLLTSGEARRKDIAISVALGASRGRLAARSMAESVLLALTGGILGMALAFPASKLLAVLAPATMPRMSTIQIDLPVLLFALLVAVVTAALSGAVPLVRAFRDADADMLRSAGRSAGPAGGRNTQRTQSLLVIGEIAVAVTLLAGAGLLARSLSNLQRTELGFSPARVITARITLPGKAYTDPRAIAMIDSIVGRIRDTPTVTNAAAMAWTPIVDGGGMWTVVGDDRSAHPIGSVLLAAPQQATPGFFEVMSTPILKGRSFVAADAAASELVAVVNERFATAMWPGVDPIGRHFRMDSNTAKWVTVVGLAANTRTEGLTEPAPAMMYFPHAQAAESAYFASYGMTLMARTTGDVSAVAKEIRRIVREADSNVPVSDVRTLDEVVGGSIASQRFTAALVAGFAALAAMLAGVGIYGVIAYRVAQRRFEIGVRMALGAARATILAGVMRRGFALSAIGLVVGIAGAFVVGRLLRGLLFEVPPVDPAVLGGVALVLFGVSSAALVVPSLRAMRVNPTETLRNR